MIVRKVVGCSSTVASSSGQGPYCSTRNHLGQPEPSWPWWDGDSQRQQSSSGQEEQEEMSSTSCDTHTINGTISPSSASEVDHVMILSDNFKNNLYLNPEYADVHLVVEGVKFPAHRIILASRSEYFRALLFGGMRETTQPEVELKGASTAAFKTLLKYVYSGKLSLAELKEDVILDVLGLCHQWGFEDLEKSVCDYLKNTLHVGNVCAILDTALVYGLDSLVTNCCVFGDQQAITVLENPSFVNLSPAGVSELISRDSFCASEEKIFEYVAGWVRSNKDIHSDAGSVLSHVRLPLMKIETLLEVVRPTNLVSPDSILDAIQIQKKAKHTELQYRGYLMPEENVAHMKHGATVLKGEMRQAVLDGDCSNYDVERGFTRHIIDETGEGNGGIVIKLRQQCILNHIQMLLWDKDLRSYSYYIEVSMDNEDWVRVCDHTKYHCRSWQNIFFPSRVIQYIKIVGTHNTVNRMFHVVQVQAFYTKRTFSIHPTYGLLSPKENVATIDMSACVIEGVSRSRNALIDGKTHGYDWDSGYTCHQLGSGAIVVQLAQPYVISSMRLLLWDCDDRRYSYYIEVSTNQRSWEMVCNRSREKCKSWQIIRFRPLPVVYIRIVGTDNTANEVFHCVHFECPAQVEDDAKSTDPSVVTGESRSGIDGSVSGGSSGSGTQMPSTSAANGLKTYVGLHEAFSSPAVVRASNASSSPLMIGPPIEMDHLPPAGILLDPQRHRHRLEDENDVEERDQEEQGDGEGDEPLPISPGVQEVLNENDLLE